MPQLNQREIKITKCDTNGKLAKIGCPHHFYIILSMNKYNQIASELLGVPLTSKINDFTLNYGLDITNDDIEGDFALDKQTFILCDRPCRISKSDLGTMKTDGSRISKELFTRIVDNISHFIRYGKRLGA